MTADGLYLHRNRPDENITNSNNVVNTRGIGTY